MLTTNGINTKSRCLKVQESLPHASFLLLGRRSEEEKGNNSLSLFQNKYIEIWFYEDYHHETALILSPTFGKQTIRSSCGTRDKSTCPGNPDAFMKTVALTAIKLCLVGQSYESTLHSPHPTSSHLQNYCLQPS